MSRLAACCAALLCALTLPASALATGVRATRTAVGTVTGTVTDLEPGSFTVQTAGRRMGVIDALIASADRVAQGDYPYVWGGGHAEAGVASVGSRGPGHHGRRLGFDCSGSVAAVLAGAGLWRWGSGVPSDAGVISELRSQGLIARGAGRAPAEVTLYDDPGIHIFMNIDGRFFGTSDGGGGGNRRGGAGWLSDGAWDATSRAFRQYHILPSVLKDRTTYGHDFTFTDGAAAPLAGSLQLGDRVSVGYEQDTAGGMTATALTWPGASTVTGVLIGTAPDGSSFEVQLPSGQTLTLSTGAFAGLLSGTAAGQEVSVTYTSQAGELLARALQVLGTPSTPGPVVQPASARRSR